MTELSREELGRMAYEAAAKVSFCDQPWEHANKKKWIAAAAAIYEAGAKSERAVSDRLLDALKALDQAEKDGIHFCASGLPIWEKARATLAEVEAMLAASPQPK